MRRRLQTCTGEQAQGRERKQDISARCVWPERTVAACAQGRVVEIAEPALATNHGRRQLAEHAGYKSAFWCRMASIQDMY